MTHRIKVVGIGTAGINVLNELMAASLTGIAFAAIHTDARSLSGCSAAEKVQLETKLFRGLGTGSDPERGRAMAEEQLPKLKALCEGVEAVLILSGLGGGAGTGISPVLARAAKESGALALAFVVLPFDCEGTVRSEAANSGLERLKDAADLVFTLPNQQGLMLIEKQTSLADTFKATNQLLANTVHCACMGLASETLMGLPLAELCAATRQRSSDCACATAQATGPNRVSELVERLITHPMLCGMSTLQEAQAVAVWVLGGVGLAMVEVNSIMEQLRPHCQGVPLIMGAGVSQEAGDVIFAGLLVARPEETSSAPATTEQPAESRPANRSASTEMGVHLLDQGGTARPHSRFVPPPPEMSPEKMEQLRARQGAGGRGRKSAPKLRQTQLPLEIVSKGRFDKSEPTIHKGEDLDVPTYIRRGVALN